MTPREAIVSGVQELAQELPDAAIEQFMRYVELLGKWNKTYNLTAIRSPLEMVSIHLLDSLAVLPHLPVPERHGRLADVGSGAGLPGIPVAIARPNWHVTLNDANQKKAAFLRQAAIELKLGNVEVHEGRVEAWHPSALFDVAISRAFAELAEFFAACRHLVRKGGMLAAMKGAAPAPAGEAAVIPLRVPQVSAQRHLVLKRVAS